MSLLIAGSTGIDDISTVNGGVENVLGGSAFHAAFGAYHFSKVCVSGMVGHDFPKEFIDVFESKNIDISGVLYSPQKTFRWKGHYSENFNDRQTLELHLGAWLDYTGEIPTQYTNCSTVFLANMGPAQQKSVYEATKKNAKFFILDTMNFYITNFRNELNDAINCCDLFFLNEEEYKLLTEESNPFKAAKKIFNEFKNVKYLIIKKGSHGTILFSKLTGEQFILPAYPVENVVDPTGAGDSFGGALGAWLDKIGDFSFSNMKRGLVYATIVASFNVEGFSVDAIKNTSIENIERRYNEFTKMILL